MQLNIFVDMVRKMVRIDTRVEQMAKLKDPITPV